MRPPLGKARKYVAIAALTMTIHNIHNAGNLAMSSQGRISAAQFANSSNVSAPV
jgi:hypothetical protein